MPSVFEYSIAGYGSMIADRVRMDAYVQALCQAVTPESVVLDIGSGTGIFALLACRYGARKIYAIEPSDAIQVAHEIAVGNGYANRIEFIQDISTCLNLEEQADVIISDMRGVLPFFEHYIPSIVDARKRLLANNGVMIPERDTLWAALVESADLYDRHYTRPWKNNAFDLDMGAAQQIVTNTWCKEYISSEQLLVEPQCLVTLDYHTIESPDFSSEVRWIAKHAGTAHGFTIWFDTILAEGVAFSNAPSKPELVYGNAFFPFSTPVSLNAGDKVTIALKANLIGDDYVWRWDTIVLGQGDPKIMKANFKQSTLFGVPLSPAQLRKRADSHTPILTEEGEIDQLILAQMNGEVSLGDISQHLSSKFPNRFPKWQDALSRVGELSKKYSR